MGYKDLALELAVKAHAGQVDKVGCPYIEHPLAVADMVEGDIAKAVALLHDVVEDTDVTLDNLREKGFPPEIVNAVEAITKLKGEGYEDYLKRVVANRVAALVKLADLKHNSQLSRFKHPSGEDVRRCERYKKRLALFKLMN